MKKTTLLLARHGETVDNANRIMQGQTQGRLNENGIRQAEELAGRMKEIEGGEEDEASKY